MTAAEPAASEEVAADEMSEPELTAALEGLLVALDRPLEAAEVAAAWGLAAERVATGLAALRADYESSGRGFALRETAGGWRLFAVPAVHDRLRAVATRESTARLSAAALETLAVVAYQQPVTRARVAAVRGVNADAVLRTLTTRGLVDIVETDPATGAGRYGTTTAFLDALGLQCLDELPDLAPLLPDVASVLGASNEGST